MLYKNSFKLLFVIILITNMASAVTVKLGWSTQQAQTWEQMRVENHPIFQRLESEANSAVYNDYGIHDGLYYLVTGDVSYAQSAYATVSDYVGVDGIGTREDPNRNTTRHHFGDMALLYSWIADDLPAADKAHFRSILEYWCTLVFDGNASNIGGTRSVDSDESTGHYMGVIMFALAIRDEDLAHSDSLINHVPAVETVQDRPVGGLDATGINRVTMRNTIADYVNLAKGGEWLESTQYNAATLRYLIEYSRAINGAQATDVFPEITDLLAGVAESQIQKLTYNFDDISQWGDIQAAHDPFIYNRLSLVAVLAYYTQDARLNTLFDVFFSRIGNGSDPHYLIYANPYAQRLPITGRDHNASGRGITYYHTGWQSDDSFFSSAHFGYTGVDHSIENETNFSLYKNQEWIIDHPRGYGLKPKSYNTLLISGGIFSAKEGRGQIASDAGSNFSYHVGTTGGSLAWRQSTETIGPGGSAYRSAFYDPPPESLHEWTRSYLYLHHEDQSDSVIIFDRLNNSNPVTSDAFDRYDSLHLMDEIVRHNAFSQLVFHLPTDQITEVNNSISWLTDNGQNVSLISFMSSNYTTELINETTIEPNFLGPTINESELKYQVRIISDQKSGHQTMLNIVRTGSSANISHHVANTGARAEALLIETASNSKIALFNGDAGLLPYSVNGTAVAIEPTPTINNRAQHDPLRQNKNSQLRFFQTGFSLTLTTNSNTTDVYLMDLDPNSTPFVSVDGQLVNATVSDAGLMQFQVQQSGQHTIVLYFVDLIFANDFE